MERGIMESIQLKEDIKPLSEVRANIAACIRTIRRTKRPLVVTQHGRGAAVIMDIAQYESLLDKIRLLKDIQTGMRQIDRGLGIDHDKAHQTILKRIAK